MLRAVVGCSVGTLALVAVACSTTTEPGATPHGIAHQQVAGAPIPVAAGVRVTPLPVFDNGVLTPTAFNDLDEVVGDSSVFTVFRWSQSRGLQVLSIPDTGMFFAFAQGVDVQGRVALTFRPQLSPTGHVAVWEPNGAFTVDSGLGPGQSCQAFGMNSIGVIAGTCDTLAVIWPQSGVPQTLRTSTGAVLGGIAAAISNDGYLAVEDNDLFVFSPSGRLSFLANARVTPVPLAVNDLGVVVGNEFDINITGFAATVWPSPDSAIDLAPGAGGTANGVADDGNVIGAVVDTVRQIVVPFIWNTRSGLRRLPGLEADSLGLREQGRAIAINSRRQVLGFLTLTTGATRWVIWNY